MFPYVVRQGEHLVGIAMRYGCDADDVWDDPANAALKKLRGGDGSILAPGDILYVPKVEPKWLAIKVGSTNRFVVSIPQITVSLVVGSKNDPFEDEPFVVTGADSPIKGTSGPGGTVTFEVSALTQSVSLEFTNRQIAIPLLIGHLDPNGLDSGVRQRLENLGYFPRVDVLEGGTPLTSGPEDDGLARAIRQFQRDAGLDATGEFDDKTRATLEEKHGS